LCLFTTRWYAERSIAMSVCSSARLWRWGIVDIGWNTWKTRSAGKSPTWGRPGPAPQVRVENKFRPSSFIFSIFEMSIRSGNIRDQSRKLSEIAPKFGRFLPSQILGGGYSKNCTHISTRVSRHVVWKSFVRILPLAPKYMDAYAEF